MTDKKLDNMPETIDIGQTLKMAREKQDISQATAAMQTNLSHDVISKLETNQFNEIGAPVFTRGYLNIYARFLGLDAVKLSNAFNNIDYQHQTDIRLTPANVASQQKSFKRNPILKWLLLVPIFLLIAFILMQVMSQDSWLMQQVKNAFPETEPTSAQSVDASTGDIVLEIDDPTMGEGESNLPTGQNVPGLTSLESVEDSDEEGLDTPIEPNLAEQPNQDINLTLESTSDEVNDASLAENTSEGEEVNTVVEETTATPDASGLLTMSDENWVEVKNNAGETIASRIFYQDETIALPASGSPYSLNIGRPNSISLTINGETRDLSTFKRSGSTRLFEVEIQ